MRASRKKKNNFQPESNLNLATVLIKRGLRCLQPGDSLLADKIAISERLTRLSVGISNIVWANIVLHLAVDIVYWLGTNARL